MYQTKLGTGLNPDQYRALLDKLLSDVGIETIEAHENVTSAYGFMYTEAVESQGLSERDIIDYVKNIIGELNNENENCEYKINDKISLYIGYPERPPKPFTSIN